MTSFSFPLISDRLSLRPPRPTDRDFFVALYGDEDVMRFIPPHNAPLGEEEAAQRLWVLMDHWRDFGYGMFVVSWKETDEPLGYCGLRYLSEVDAIELGAILGKKSWGQGVGPEAGRMCIAFARDQLKADRIVSLTDPENARSGHVLTAFGFSRRPELDGEYHGMPHLFFEMALQHDTPSA
ncbi:GNAT family N-acetyltransferase [Desulfoluna butyratoxydans]|uniref:Acyl-coa n-acyltransferase n=1 Tax=Desulfoluna butyratoxydans TaxID=231438 RepID=A0A4U8YIJ3_9BACT|nr:GNAT family N-acetyltransferase [Desulfoluna butyratoxydans]VFQ42769.1 acyl-coa n-acyltransferase [Desulfoluna butyratoxydans]